MQALDSCLKGNLEYGLALLRVAATEYFSARKLPAMLPKAVMDFMEGMKLVPKSAPERVEYANVFLQAIKSKLATSVSVADLEAGIDTANFLVTHSPETYGTWEVWHDLLTLYTKRLEITDDRSVSLVDAAIAAGEACLKDTALPPTLRRRCHYDLCNVFFTRFSLRDKSIESDIISAVEHGKRLIEDAPPNDEKLARWYVALSRALAARYSATREPQDLRDAVECAESAKAYFDDGFNKGVDKATVLNNLSNRLGDRYAASGSSQDPRHAIELAREVLELAHGAPDLRVYKQNLIDLLNTSFNDSGNEKHLEEAISLGRELIQGEERKPDRGRPANLTVLASSLSYRYSLRHSLDDVREAIKLVREAIRLTDASHLTYNVMRSNLSKFLKLLYARTKNSEIMREVLEIQEAVYHSNNPDRSEMPRYMDLLASSYDDLFLQTDNVKYSDKALELGQSVIAMRDPPDPSRAVAYTNQSARYWSRWTHRRDSAALDQSIDHGWHGLGCYAETQPDRALACNNLGTMLNARYNVSGQAGDRAEAIRVFFDAFRQENALPIIRIEAGRAAGILYGEDQRWQDSCETLEGCVRMFPRLTPRSVSRGDQQDNLAHLSGISSLACSAAIMAGKTPASCLEILETGRGVISGLAMFLEEDISRLQRLHPETYERFHKLRNAVSNALPSWEDSQAQNNEFDGLLEHIRDLDGFKSFLLCPSAEEVMSLSKRAPIVCLNVTELGSHAILVAHGEISTLPLPGLSYERLEQEAATFLQIPNVSSNTYKATNAKLRALATWLWERGVGPVLQSLDVLPQQTPRTGKLPLVYWMPCGLLSHMPIHAAGIYKPHSKERVEDYIVSSYITTLKSAVRNLNAASKQTESVWTQPMIVSMPETARRLPLAAAEEARAICKCLGLVIRSTSGDLVMTNPAKEDVKARLKDCTLAHFVCHGESSAVDPSQSRLCLGASGAAEPEMLTMEELAAMGMASGRHRLAYLSACSTAGNASSRLHDEVIHLASGFQLLGFSHVIATLWPASNRAAVPIADRFYSQLVRNWAGIKSGDGQVGNSAIEECIADALHYAVSEVRLRGIPGEAPPKWPPMDVLAWAPFVHLGL
ncbi:CHAT domain-containing protein [Lasiosphaeris hirsuta]|uniref:CHAT domain-containing protein n=1 Tax=Lasiosphaeris hirsuta TaxID=260670 RepID=A0AA40E3W3_9PEZI|nr:CHAT domain-containing protein [Lasiosphaeris hirsuta]